MQTANRRIRGCSKRKEKLVRKDRRQYPGHDRRKNGGKVFKNSEKIHRDREIALEKLELYEKDENVGIKAMSTLFAAGIFIITAIAGYVAGHEKVVFLAVAGAVASLITGEMNVRAAKKAAKKRFCEENMHLKNYVQ